MTKLCKFACVNELCQHIDKLLLSNDCVILPGFGGFLTHYADAYYSESEQLYYPPKREIGFNQNLTMNDSLLVQEIAGRYDISYPEACKRLEAEIEELRQTLQTIGHYEFTGIGTLSMIEEGVYTFEPYHAGIQTPDYYALNPLDIVEIKAIPENRRQPTESQTTSNGVSDPMQIVDSNETEVENNVAKRSNISSNTILRYVAAAAIALLVFFLSPLTLDQIGKPMY